jgi:hypothetical protein
MTPAPDGIDVLCLSSYVGRRNRRMRHSICALVRPGGGCVEEFRTHDNLACLLAPSTAEVRERRTDRDEPYRERGE